MKITYETRAFRQVSLDVISEAERICEEYAAQDISMTLRTLYYQFIARDTFPESWRNDAGTKNNQANYKKLSKLVSDARIGGLIDWGHIEDGERPARGGDFGFDGPSDAVASLPDTYGITHWAGQPEYVEVMYEKNALTQIIADPCRRWDVTYTSCKGSPSTTLMESVSQRLRYYARQGRKVTVFYLGDHDPTGLDISRDMEERMRLYRCSYGAISLERIALNLDQIEQYDPPPSPAKETDSRYQAYVDRFGITDTWELDALDPVIMRQLVEDAILSRLDQGMYNERLEQEEKDKRALRAIADNYYSIVDYAREEGWLEDED